MNKHITIILLLCLGFLLAPAFSYACAPKTTIAVAEKTCCSKKKAGNKEQTKDCCKSQSKNAGEHQDCGDSSCKCGNTASPVFNLTPPLVFKLGNIFPGANKHNFSPYNARYSAGFSTIWQPPKIA